MSQSAASEAGDIILKAGEQLNTLSNVAEVRVSAGSWREGQEAKVRGSFKSSTSRKANKFMEVEEWKNYQPSRRGKI
jgi:hypothetical protein